MTFQGNNVFHKLWYFLSTYILTLKRFDLFLQGSLLILILLETNVYLLLKRDASEGYLPGLVKEWVMVAAAGAEVLLGVLVGWWGRDRRQIALCYWLAATSACGLLVLAFPYAYSNPASVELCGGTPLSVVATPAPDTNVNGRIVFLILTALHCTITKVSIWSHGLTYLDDHDPQNGPYFYGILICIRLSLGLSGNNWLFPSSVSDDWWKAHLSLCMLTFMFAPLFTLFPRRMKSCMEVDEMGVDTGLLPTLNRLIRNKALVIQSFGLACMSAAVFCFVHYDKDYVQARFHVETARQDPRTSRALSDIFRSLVIIFFVMIFRIRFSARRSDGVKANTASRVAGVVAIFVTILFIIMSFVSCNTSDIAGVDDGVYSQPSCSQNCGCTSERYGFSPVCVLDTRTTYFSPCNAGCTSSEDLIGFPLFHNCSCGVETSRAVRGACSLISCRFAFSTYQVLFTIMLAVSGACLMMQGMVILRAVRPADKVVAVAASFSLVALLAYVLGNLLYLMISQLTCAYLHEDECLLNNSSMWSVPATSATLAALAAVTSIIASKTPGVTPVPTTEL